MSNQASVISGSRSFPLSGEMVAAGIVILGQVLTMMHEHSKRSRIETEEDALRSAVFRRVEMLTAQARREPTAEGRAALEARVQLLLTLLTGE